MMSRFIRQTGIERVSSYLVNNPDKTLNMAKAQVTLNRLIELGREMAQEQGRLVRSQLAQEYVAGVGQTNGRATPPLEMPVQTSDNLLEHRESVDFAAAVAPQDWPSHVSLPNVERLLERSLQQGGRLSLEVASPREKSGNIWRSWPWSQSPENTTKAVDSILDCIRANPRSYVKLIGYNPKTQTRLLEETIVRPQ
jgi:ribulose bisphosphate carboxylase small subunit